jgi:hypothetical protein
MLARLALKIFLLYLYTVIQPSPSNKPTKNCLIYSLSKLLLVVVEYKREIK